LTYFSNLNLFLIMWCLRMILKYPSNKQFSIFQSDNLLQLLVLLFKILPQVFLGTILKYLGKFYLSTQVGLDFTTFDPCNCFFKPWRLWWICACGINNMLNERNTKQFGKKCTTLESLIFMNFSRMKASLMWALKLEHVLPNCSIFHSRMNPSPCIGCEPV
jgi:hypothetical protein